MKTKHSTQEQRCSKCAALLTCGYSQHNEACWCSAYPSILSIDAQQDCLCEPCLSLAIQDKITHLIKTSSQQELIAKAQPYRKDKKLLVGLDYLIEDGNWVFTQWFHLKRGSCCGNACKNCPY
ncbi:MAG: DUF5522 domain-containing protein [Methylococcales bacterium]